MSDYISRDVAIIEFMDNDIDHIQAPNGKEAVQILSDIPVADVVPVVRCKDCNYHSFDAESGRWWCNLTSGVRKVNHNDFCSDGRKKET